MASATQPFSVEAFRELFRSSRAMKYLSRMEIEQIRRALEEKNISLLERLFPVLVDEQGTDEEIVREFVMAKNRIVDDFAIETADIEETYIAKNLKKKRAAAESKDKKKADKILREL